MPLTDHAKHHLFRWLRAGFRLTPLPAGTRDRLRQRFIDGFSHLLPRGPKGTLPIGSASQHRPVRHAGGRAIGHVSYRAPSQPLKTHAPLIAFYLPQFHTIAENDAWWGKGFTEWNNVSRALPQFDGHEQPRLPGELGFYDLQISGIMRRQMELARDYGIAAFCTYFYWFGGKTLLEAPLRNWLDDSTLTLPICLCWANENWSRRWDGRAQDLLISQEHSEEDDCAFIAHVSDYLRDARYLRVGGKPMLLVYRPGLLPDPKATTQRWRQWCRDHGLGEIYLAYVQSFDRVDPASIGFDAAVEFPPNNTSLEPITARQQLINPDFQGDVLDWRELASEAENRPDPDYVCFPGVNPGWDNEPRRSGRGRVFLHASPRRYGQWLGKAISSAARRLPAHPLVFINAWNEWAEGAVLEPDARLGYAWLQATRDAVSGATSLPAKSSRPCAVIHAWYVDVLDELVAALRTSTLDWRVIITTAQEREEDVRARVQALRIDAEVIVCENRGRDVLPFLEVAGRLYAEGVRIVLKIHTKRSTHRQDGEAWRRELVEKLLAPERATRILSAFERRPELGLVAADGHVQPLSYYWGANQANVEYLCRRMGIEAPDPEHDHFVAGTMFWVRLDAMLPLLDSHLGVWEFEDEAGQVDGTLAHAVERVFCLAARHQQLLIEEGTTTCGLPHDVAPSTHYPYARRSDRTK